MKLRLYASALGLKPETRAKVLRDFGRINRALDRSKKAFDRVLDSLENAATAVSAEDPALAGSISGLKDSIEGVGVDLDDAIGDVGRFRDREKI